MRVYICMCLYLLYILISIISIIYICICTYIYKYIYDLSNFTIPFTIYVIGFVFTYGRF